MRKKSRPYWTDALNAAAAAAATARKYQKYSASIASIVKKNLTRTWRNFYLWFFNIFYRNPEREKQNGSVLHSRLFNSRVKKNWYHKNFAFNVTNCCILLPVEQKPEILSHKFSKGSSRFTPAVLQSLVYAKALNLHSSRATAYSKVTCHP